LILQTLLATEAVVRTAQLHDLPLDADQEDQLGLGGDVEGALLLGNAGKADLLALGIAVLLDVLLGTLEDDAALLLVDLDCIC
jgi:hypothetical protein